MPERKFKFSKLVRDNIVNSIVSSGNKPVWSTLSDLEYVRELKNKVVEEAMEIPRTEDPKEVVKELADVQELIDNLLEAMGIPKDEFVEIQKNKRKRSGSFKKKQYIDHVVTVDDDSEWARYYMANPDKYPEI